MLPVRQRPQERERDFELALKFYKRQKFAEAEIFLRLVVQERERVLGQGHIDTFSGKYKLARTLHKQQKYPEAELLFRQLVQEQARILGQEHEDTLGSKYKLARTLYEQQKYAQAEQLFQRLVQERERVLGQEHKDTLNSKYKLAKTLYEQQKYAQAEQLFQCLVQEQERVLGLFAEKTLFSKHWLAQTSFKQQKFLEAEKLFQLVVQEREKVLGQEHEDTLDSKYRLARTLYEQQKYPQAEKLIQRLVQEQERVLGQEHEDTLSSKYWLAQMLYEQQKYPQAEMLFQQLIQEQERVLGLVHKDTLDSKHWLAQTLYKQQKYLEARNIFQQLVQVQESLLGQEHEDTFSSKYKLGRTLHKQQRYSDAEQLFQQLVQEQERVLGWEHKDTRLSKHWLVKTLYKQQEYPKATQLCQQLVNDKEKILGKEHEDTLKSKRLLQSILFASSPPAPVIATTETAVGCLSDFFVEDRAQYTDTEILQVSILLSHLNPQWSRVPRTYTLLRIIGCLNLLDTFIDLGFTDYWFPVTEKNLPHCLPPSRRSEFVAAQNLVISKSMDLEKGEGGQHCYFQGNEPLPFEVKGVLGSGGFGQVDKILSLASFREYARKRVPRNKVFGGRRMDAVKQFIAEIDILKRLKHHHVVEFVGSYSDSKYMGLIMSPVADTDLCGYLKHVDAIRYGELRTFFGCLARALEFLHEQNIRHKDIKPANILVCHGNVLLTDFGLSFDFTDAEGSTTVSMVNGMTPRYCAPEVVMFEPRNTSSDIWSLGVVFLEMFVTLRGRSADYIYKFLKENGSQQPFIRTNPDGFSRLVAEVKGTGSVYDNAPLAWIQDMLLMQPRLRPTAAALVASITATGKEGERNRSFCGICCVSREDDFSDEISEFENDNRDE